MNTKKKRDYNVFISLFAKRQPLPSQALIRSMRSCQSAEMLMQCILQVGLLQHHKPSELKRHMAIRHPHRKDPSSSASHVNQITVRRSSTPGTDGPKPGEIVVKNGTFKNTLVELGLIFLS